jgi:hypothetical protein
MCVVCVWHGRVSLSRMQQRTRARPAWRQAGRARHTRQARARELTPLNHNGARARAGGARPLARARARTC